MCWRFFLVFLRREKAQRITKNIHRVKGLQNLWLFSIAFLCPIYTVNCVLVIQHKQMHIFFHFWLNSNHLMFPWLYWFAIQSVRPLSSSVNFVSLAQAKLERFVKLSLYAYCWRLWYIVYFLVILLPLTCCFAFVFFANVFTFVCTLSH